MSEAHRRKKEPEQLREKLLAAAAHLVAEQGVGAVTLNAVSARAGVSKGGLQHHFGSKQELLDALANQLYQRFVEEVQALADADPEPRGRSVRAYLRAVARGFSGGAELEAWQAATVLVMTQPRFRELWQTWEARAMQADQAHTCDARHLLICRLAAEGLWLADVLGHRTLAAHSRAELLQELERMTYDNP